MSESSRGDLRRHATTKAYSSDLRERVTRCIEGGASAREAARIYLIIPSSAVKWVQRWRTTGGFAASLVRGHRRSPLSALADWLLALMAGQPDMTLEEMRSSLRERDVLTSNAVLWWFFDLRGISYKKNLHAVEQQREDLALARAIWKEGQAALDAGKLVFVDETGTNTSMTRLRGRFKRSERLIGRAPHSHWKTTTFVAGLRNSAITAPLVIDQPMNGAIFLAWLEQFLIPTLCEGDIVVMDSLRAHTIASVRALMQAACAKLLYLPPYSPYLNPSKMAFAKLKAMLREAA